MQFEKVYESLHRACRGCGRDPKKIRILAVSKRQPLNAMLAYQEFCKNNDYQCFFGENYAQELLEKASAIHAPIHFIGGIQGNKIPLLLEHAALIETLSSRKHATQMQKEAERQGKEVGCFLQVNISSDEAKHGCDIDELPSLIHYVDTECHSLRLSGFMTITRYYEETEHVRPDYRRMKEIFDAYAPKDRDFCLSMGMSSDYDIAIEEGATEVRIGSSLFGARPSS